MTKTLSKTTHPTSEDAARLPAFLDIEDLKVALGNVSTMTANRFIRTYLPTKFKRPDSRNHLFKREDVLRGLELRTVPVEVAVIERA
jgi:hypothetical protein